MKTCFNFFRLLFFKGKFKFYLIAVLICYLYFIIYRRAHNIFGTLWRVSFLPKYKYIMSMRVLAHIPDNGRICGVGGSVLIDIFLLCVR